MGGGEWRYFGPKFPIESKIDAKDFKSDSWSLKGSIVGLIKSKKILKNHGLIINWKRDINSQSITI